MHANTAFQSLSVWLLFGFVVIQFSELRLFSGLCSFEGIKCILMDNCTPFLLPQAEIAVKIKSRIVKHIYLPQTTVSTLNN